MSEENTVRSFRICFEPDGGVYCNKILEVDETREMTEADAIHNSGIGTTIEIVDVSLDVCEYEILESLLVLNHYMDAYDLEYLLCKLLDAGFKTGIKYAAVNSAAMKTDSNCVKMVDVLMNFSRERSNATALSTIYERVHTLIEKSNFGRVETEISLDMKNDTEFGRIMLQDWMEIANDFGNLTSDCFNDFGHVALDVKEIANGKSVTVYFQPELR